MTRRRKILWLGCGLAAGLLALALGPWRPALFPWRTYLGRPAGYWRYEVLRWHTRLYAHRPGSAPWSPAPTDQLLARVGVAYPATGPAVLGKATGAVPVLANLLHDPDARVRLLAGTGLLQNAGPEAARVLAEALRDGDPAARDLATALLAMKGPDAVGAVPTLCEVYSYGDPDSRGRAAYCLGRMEASSRAALLELIDGSNGMDRQVRRSAVAAVRDLSEDLWSDAPPSEAAKP